MTTDEPIIDAWIQHPTPQMLGHEMFDSLRRWMGIEELPEEIPPELTVGALDAAGIERAMLSAWWGPEGPLISNREVAALVEEYPDRFSGIASVDISRPVEAVSQLRHWVKAGGFRGVRILPWLWEAPPDDRRYYPIYVACVELDVPFCLQVGHAGPLKPSDPGRPIPYLDRVALDFPDLTIVAGHVGYPWTDEMVALARKYPNVYIDTSAYKPSRFPRPLIDYLRADGGRKVMFGSNYPMIMPADCLEGLDELNLEASTLRSFLGQTARSVFGPL